MDLRSRMHGISLFAALCAALGAAVFQSPVMAAVALAGIQGLLYALSGIVLCPMKSAWLSGTRRGSDARRWMLSALCGGLAGAGVLLFLDVLVFKRFDAHLPALCALCAALCARGCAIAVFDRRIRRVGVSVLGSVSAFAGVLVCMYPFL